MAARAVRRETPFAAVVQNRLGHDGSCGIAGAEEQDVIVTGHRLLLCLGLDRGAAAWGAAGFGWFRGCVGGWFGFWFGGSDEGTEELAFDLRGDGVDVDTCFGEEL